MSILTIFNTEKEKEHVSTPQQIVFFQQKELLFPPPPPTKKNKTKAHTHTHVGFCSIGFAFSSASPLPSAMPSGKAHKQMGCPGSWHGSWHHHTVKPGAKDVWGVDLVIQCVHATSLLVFTLKSIFHEWIYK